MTLSDRIYQFRRTEEGMDFENITKFREAYKQHHRTVTSKQVLEALADRPDVRNFSNSGQAKNPHMLSSACEQYRNRLTTRLGEILAIDDANSLPLVLALIPPLNDDELFGYRRPNLYYSQAPLSPASGGSGGADAVDTADMSACAAADAAVLEQFQPLFKFSPIPYTKKVKGHVYQYIRSVVLQHYHHQPLSEEAWTHWVKNTTLGGVQFLPQPLVQGKRKKTMVPFDDVPHSIMLATLRRIHQFFPLSWSTFVRYLTEPMPKDIRDHFKTVVCTALLVALDLEENKDLLMKVTLRIRSAMFLDICFPGIELVGFNPSAYRSQSEVLRLLDWQNEDAKVLYWQVSARLHNIRPTGGDFTETIEAWKRKEQEIRFPRLTSGPFNTVDLAICDRYWLDGYPAALMEERMSQVLGRDLRYLRIALGAHARRWTYSSNGGARVIVEDIED